MSTLIVYATKHGTTEKAAKNIKDQISEDVTLHNLKDRKTPNLSNFNNIIIGGSIHAGQVQAKVKKFCLKHEETLCEKNLGLYLCYMDNSKAKMQFDSSYSEKLRQHAYAKGLFGGEFLFEKMNFFERLIIKKINGSTISKSEINTDEINSFANKFNILAKNK